MIVFIYQTNGYDRQYQSFDCYRHSDNKEENIKITLIFIGIVNKKQI